MGADRRIVCIAGMHCSGTSAIARILNLLGLEMGPPEVAAPARRSNTKGLWEYPPLTRLGEQVLRAMGGTWDDPPPLRLDEPALEPLRAQAREIVAGAYPADVAWGWKDPRNSLLVPFWTDLLGPLRFVVCVRHPEDVAASLGKRDGMPRDRALALWQRYTGDLLAATEDAPRAIVHYEDLWAGPQAFRRLAALLGDEAAADSEAFRAAAAEWLDPDMWNNRAGAERDVSMLPEDIAALYRRLVPERVG